MILLVVEENQSLWVTMRETAIHHECLFGLLGDDHHEFNYSVFMLIMNFL